MYKIALLLALLSTTATASPDGFCENPLYIKTHKEIQKCETEKAIKKSIDAKLTMSDRLQNALNVALNKQNHDHLKQKINQSHAAFLYSAKFDCTAESWISMQSMIDEQAIQNIDTETEQSTIQNCIDQKYKQRITYIKNNY